MKELITGILDVFVNVVLLLIWGHILICCVFFKRFLIGINWIVQSSPGHTKVDSSADAAHCQSWRPPSNSYLGKYPTMTIQKSLMTHLSH